MPDLATWGILAAALGGLVSFSSPCTLPLVPGYLSVVTGGAVTEASNQLKALWLSICFVLGFSVVFVALGASASLLGQWLMAYRQEANLAAGVMIVLMGLFMLGWWSMPALQRDWRRGQTLEGGRVTAAFVLGLALPFLGTAMFIEHFRERMRGFSRWSRPLRALAGLVLIIMGVMVLTGQMTRFASWMLSAFPVLG